MGTNWQLLLLTAKLSDSRATNHADTSRALGGGMLITGGGGPVPSWGSPSPGNNPALPCTFQALVPQAEQQDQT